MVSATATTKSDASWRAFAGSRITRIIFIWNFVGLAVLIVGVLLLSEMRAGLTDAEYRNLRTQGELVTNLLIETGTVAGDPNPYINGDAVRDVMQRLLPPIAEGGKPGQSGPRIIVADDRGNPIADSDVIYDRLEERPIGPPGQNTNIADNLQRTVRNIEYVRLTPWRPTTSLPEERTRAMHGEIAGGERLDENGDRVVSVTLPIRRVQAVLGTVTLESADVERILVAERASMIPFIIGAAIAILLSSLLLAWSIAQPLRRLSGAADSLRVTGATRLHLPDVAKRKDEIGALAHSLEAMTAALADRIDANERFAADVSHEIKNPLASIRSAVDSAQAVKDEERRGKLLGIVAQDVKRLDRLITDISRASRIEAETARTDLGEVDLGQMLFELARAYPTPEDDPHHVEVVFIGNRPVGAIVMGQAGALGQVFRNLIDNARSFSPEGGRVTVKLEVAKGTVKATVEDQGPGIPPENLETIFRRFYTERPRGAAFGGNSGLGLSIARQIVTAHNGRIYAQNIENDGHVAGARLVVEMPVAPPPKL